MVKQALIIWVCGIVAISLIDAILRVLLGANPQEVTGLDWIIGLLLWGWILVGLLPSLILAYFFPFGRNENGSASAPSSSKYVYIIFGGIVFLILGFLFVVLG